MRSRCGAGVRRHRRGSGARGAAGPCGKTRGGAGLRPGETRAGFQRAPAARAPGAWTNGRPAADAAATQTRTAHAVQAEVQARARRSGSRGSLFGTPAPQSEHARSAAKLGKAGESGLGGTARRLQRACGRSTSGPTEGGVPAALTLGVWLLAMPAADPEPGLLETQEAAARAAGGSPAQDASRVARSVLRR